MDASLPQDVAVIIVQLTRTRFLGRKNKSRIQDIISFVRYFVVDVRAFAVSFSSILLKCLKYRFIVSLQLCVIFTINDWLRMCVG